MCIIPGLLSDLVCHWIRPSVHSTYQGKGYPRDFTADYRPAVPEFLKQWFCNSQGPACSICLCIMLSPSNTHSQWERPLSWTTRDPQDGKSQRPTVQSVRLWEAELAMGTSVRHPYFMGRHFSQRQVRGRDLGQQLTCPASPPKTGSEVEENLITKSYGSRMVEFQIHWCFQW